MKLIISTLIFLLSQFSFAGVPPKITVVGSISKIENSIVFIKSSSGVVKVPRGTLKTKSATTGAQVIAMVPVKDFLKLN